MIMAATLGVNPQCLLPQLPLLMVGGSEGCPAAHAIGARGFGVQLVRYLMAITAKHRFWVLPIAIILISTLGLVAFQ